jgi:GNAT superfamily N-acetyltransferase/ribosomal protein S27AE
MNLRPAGRDDSTAIRETAERSFQTSYAISPEQIETLVEVEFADDALGDRVESDEDVLVVAEEEGTVRAFAAVEFGEEAVLRWLHVHPEHRGGGLGTALFEHVQEAAADRNLPLSVRVLTEATEGRSFPNRFGFEETGSDHYEVGGERFAEEVLAKGAIPNEATEPAVDVPDTVALDGEERPVDREEPIPGNESPFFPIYATADRTERYGFLCSNCGATDVSADGLDRLECGNCGNMHRADEWDAAYL